MDEERASTKKRDLTRIIEVMYKESFLQDQEKDRIADSFSFAVLRNV